MKKSFFHSIFTWDSVLVFSVFLCAFVIPVFPPSWGIIPIRVGFTMIFLSGLLTMEKPQLRILYLALAAFVMEWVSSILDLEYIAYISRFLNIIFFIIVIGSLFREMVTAKIVTARLILSSISGYILLGIIYSVLIVTIMQQDEAAFNLVRGVNSTNTITGHLSDSMYFGFVTLASLGYGDILPLKPYSRSLATLIAISGQLYIATIIGIMIGKFVSRADSGNSGNNS